VEMPLLYFKENGEMGEKVFKFEKKAEKVFKMLFFSQKSCLKPNPKWDILAVSFIPEKNSKEIILKVNV
jgi:hypothetical protein